MINVRNIYYMLAYTFQALNRTGVASVALEDFDNAADLFAAILAQGISSQIKRGLGREYCTQEDLVKSPRGKILTPETMMQEATHTGHAACSFDVFSTDTYANQILRATGLLLIRSEHVQRERKQKLKRCMLYFDKVSELNPQKIDWSKVRIGKTNSSYLILINLCKIILSGMIQTTTSGSVKVADFLDDTRMSSLYEHFVLEFYRRHYPELQASPSFIQWNVDNGLADFLPSMKTDITLRCGDRWLIIDTKYYSKTLQNNPFYDKKTLHSNNMYQIYSYVKNKDKDHVGNVSGMLLYAKTDEPIALDNAYKIDGNSFYVKTLDLDADFASIKARLNEIAELLE